MIPTLSYENTSSVYYISTFLAKQKLGLYLTNEQQASNKTYSVLALFVRQLDFLVELMLYIIIAELDKIL